MGELVSSNNTGGIKSRGFLIGGLGAIFAVIVFGLLWFLFLAPAHPQGFGWFLFSFAAGLSMIVLPCTLPLAFVIVPLSLGKGAVRGVGIALSFGAGVTLTLSLYGALAGFLGGTAMDTLGLSLENVKNWVYFIAGIFAFIFALGSVGLIKARMPSYTGSAPAGIQRRGDFLKAFLLGLFLGNIGVGCPHPATPLIFFEIASEGSATYGWLLFFVHAIGRVLPLLFLAFLGIVGVNALTWLVARKDKIERATGWAMVFVAGFILTLGLFTHKWWVNSGIHTLLEGVTQEQRLIGVINDNLGTETAHGHGLEMGMGLFGLPLYLGSILLVLLWVIPIWWWWFRERLKAEREQDARARIKKVNHLRGKAFLFAVVSIVLGLIFIWYLPFWFKKGSHPEDLLPELTHNAHTMEEMKKIMEEDNGAHNMMMEGGEMGEHASGVHALSHEADDVKSEFVVAMTALENIMVGEKVTLLFEPKILPDNLVAPKLELDHEKYLHVIGVRHDLSEFFHIHPSLISAGTEGAVWGVDYIFNKPGYYKVWVGAMVSGERHSFGQTIFTVHGKMDSPKISSSLSLTRVSEVGKYKVFLQGGESIKVGEKFNFFLRVKDKNDSFVPLLPYLGATMHLAVIKDDLTVFEHTHPSDDSHLHSGVPKTEDVPKFVLVERAYAHGAEEEEGEGVEEEVNEVKEIGILGGVPFEVTFPKEGIYKIFAEFRPEDGGLPSDRALRAEFVVSAGENSALEISENHLDSVVHEGEATESTPPIPRLALVAISVILIILLSFGVGRFLRVDA